MPDDGGDAATADCTSCTKRDVVEEAGAHRGEGGAVLPEAEPDLFLLAGVAAGRARPNDARALRARAELQAALAERNPGRR